MNSALVQTKLVGVLQQIQSLSGLECPPILGTTKPLEALPNFDSKIWPVAIGMLASELAIAIAEDVNIFIHEKSCVPMTIDEIVALVVALAHSQTSTATQTVSAE